MTRRPWKLLSLAAIATALALCVAALAQDNGHAQSDADKAALAAVDRGRKLFGTNCGFCHGPDATGKSGPDLVRSTLVNHDEKGSLLAPVIRNGRPDKGMPPFAALTDAQMAGIVAFLHARTQAVADRFSYTIDGLLTGDAKAGEAYFNGTGKCGSCHSPTGDFKGIATRYQPLDLQSQIAMPGRGNFGASPAKPVKVRVEITLPSGRKVSGTLVRMDEFDVSIRDSEGFYHSYPRQGATVKKDDPLKVHRELLRKYTDADMHNLLAYLETLK